MSKDIITNLEDYLNYNPKKNQMVLKVPTQINQDYHYQLFIRNLKKPPIRHTKKFERQIFEYLLDFNYEIYNSVRGKLFPKDNIEYEVFDFKKKGYEFPNKKLTIYYTSPIGKGYSREFKENTTFIRITQPQNDLELACGIFNIFLENIFKNK